MIIISREVLNLGRCRGRGFFSQDSQLATVTHPALIDGAIQDSQF